MTISPSFIDYFSLKSHYSQDIERVIDTLQSDPDRDVRFFSGTPFPDSMIPLVIDQNYSEDVIFTQRLSSSSSDSEEKIDINSM